jgi:hypothetical protein
MRARTQQPPSGERSFARIVEPSVRATNSNVTGYPFHALNDLGLGWMAPSLHLRGTSDVVAVTNGGSERGSSLDLGWPTVDSGLCSIG